VNRASSQCIYTSEKNNAGTQTWIFTPAYTKLINNLGLLRSQNSPNMRSHLSFIAVFPLLAMIAPTIACKCWYNGGFPGRALFDLPPHTQACCDKVGGMYSGDRGECSADSMSGKLSDFQHCCGIQRFGVPIGGNATFAGCKQCSYTNYT
jgi:hypothetical protein